MTAPDTVKPSDGLQHMMLGVCDGFDGCDVCVIAPEKYDAQMADHARIVAEKDARIAELSMLATNMEDSWKGVDRYAAMVEVERDALKAQLADAVETLKAIKRHSRFSTRQLQQWANDCLKRIGVTGDKP